MAMIITTTIDLIQIKKKLTKFFSNDEAAMTLSKHLINYAKLNLYFGLPACILHVCAYLINIWIKDDIPAALVSLGFDISCVGVSAG